MASIRYRKLLSVGIATFIMQSVGQSHAAPPQRLDPATVRAIDRAAFSFKGKKHDYATVYSCVKEVGKDKLPRVYLRGAPKGSPVRVEAAFILAVTSGVTEELLREFKVVELGHKFPTPDVSVPNVVEQNINLTYDPGGACDIGLSLLRALYERTGDLRALKILVSTPEDGFYAEEQAGHIEELWKTHAEDVLTAAEGNDRAYRNVGNGLYEGYVDTPKPRERIYLRQVHERLVRWSTGKSSSRSREVTLIEKELLRIVKQTK